MILPSGAGGPAWSRDHLRLHRWLRREPTVLPAGGSLLLALSGGQDSMALTALLDDLARLHHWRLQLWHGDHRWRPESGRQAEELAAWAAERGLPLRTERACEAAATEAGARQWRYECLAREAERLGCDRVVTGHTASDRAETALLNLARGSHLRGLASLRASRPLHGEGPSPTLVRPLLLFSRDDTARICRSLGLPVWLDPSNADPRHARNRMRAEVLPVLESLHPGASRRISALAERLAQESDMGEELVALALEALALPTPGDAVAALCRQRLAAQAPASQRRLLQLWLKRHWGRSLASEPLNQVLAGLPPARGSGRMDLADGWQLRWKPSTLDLMHGQDHG
ncbi:MAG: tRNA lysidine(34) synthetase TilS [Cyanobium sp.]